MTNVIRFMKPLDEFDDQYLGLVEASDGQCDTQIMREKIY